MKEKITYVVVAVACAGLSLLAGCESNPAKADAAPAQPSSQASAEENERCMVTGSRLPRANCRDSGVGSISRETWERTMSDRASNPPALTSGK